MREQVLRRFVHGGGLRQLFALPAAGHQGNRRYMRFVCRLYVIRCITQHHDFFRPQFRLVEGSLYYVGVRFRIRCVFGRGFLFKVGVQPDLFERCFCILLAGSSGYDLNVLGFEALQ